MVGYARCGLLLAACGGSEPAGPGFQITVAPLKLPGIFNACYSLAVYNSESTLDASTLVWSQSEVCAQTHGNGQGSISYVGTCDASVPNDNTVTLSLDLLRENPTQAHQPPPVLGAADFVNPCPPTAPCSLTAPCRENADTPVVFNLTIMRNAHQGFFDIAVNFDNIFCSAKVDCAYGAPGDPSANPIQLVHDPVTGERVQTVVFALACTDGNPGGPPETSTHLYLDPLVLTCGSSTFTIDPSAGPGNLYPGGVGAPDPLVQAMVFEGHELITNGGVDADKLYWNVALGLKASYFSGSTPTCTLTTQATASEGPLTAGTTPSGTAYPVIDVTVPLNTGADITCTQHPFGGTGDHGGVSPTYTGTGTNDAITFTYRAQRTTGEDVTTDPLELPVPVVRSLDTGEAHMCALLSDATVSCWGWRWRGVMGDGDLLDYQTTPLQTPGFSNVSVMNTGFYATCLVGDKAGEGHGVYCFGELGQSNMFPTYTYPNPTLITGFSGEVKQFAIGQNHACALIADGTVQCWGNDGVGQLGVGNDVVHYGSPTPVTTHGLSGVTAITAGTAHTCALLADKTVKCWGINYQGQLGDGTNDNRDEPTIVLMSNDAPLGDVDVIDAGNESTCAGSGTNVFCWGKAPLDYGDSQTPRSKATQTLVAYGLGAVAQLSVTNGRVCAATADGFGKCWAAPGYNTSGSLMAGFYNDTFAGIDANGRMVIEVPVGSYPTLLSDVAMVATNNMGTTCALTDAGALYCGGDNYYGGLGTGDPRTPPPPQGRLVGF